MNDLVEEHEYKGNEIRICYDTHAESPDIWENEDAFIVYDHRQFHVERKGFDPDDVWERYQTHKTYQQHYNGDNYWIFPLYAYIHSGVSLSLGGGTCKWDTSMSGFVLVKRQKGWTYSHEKATKVAESLVEEWNLYLSGQVYGYEIIGDAEDSCYGYYGDEGIEQAIEEAKGIIDYRVEELNKTHFNKLKAWIKNKVEFIYREPLIIK